MPFNVSTFASTGLPLGGARPSLFQVTITPPSALGGAAAQIPFVCKAAQIPTATLGVIEVPYFGRKIKVAGNRTFENWTVTILNDEDFAVRDLFETWHQVINSHEQNLRNGGYLQEGGGVGANSYRSVAIVKHYAKTGVLNGGTDVATGAIPSRSYKFFNIWPVSVSSIDLNWETTDTIEEFQVELAYDFWQPNDDSQGNADAASAAPFAAGG